MNTKVMVNLSEFSTIKPLHYMVMYSANYDLNDIACESWNKPRRHLVSTQI